MKRFSISKPSIFLVGVLILAFTLIVLPGSAFAAKFIRIKSSSLGGSWYAGGAAWAKLISDNTDFVAINVASPGLDNESLKRLARKECDLVFLTGPGAYNAYKGVSPTWKEPQDIRGLFGLWPGVMNVIVMADSNFQKVQDLKGASIATYIPGDINGEQALALLGAHGVQEDNTKVYRIMKSDATRMFIDKRVDAIAFTSGTDTPTSKRSPPRGTSDFYRRMLKWLNPSCRKIHFIISAISARNSACPTPSSSSALT